ncbi:hypothetical protein FSP39_010682 [Pinctada imbricata]|uniref:C1q domain-containing protein n=1 Tax=Pinctada imbricata TaxID=66713 RepID=A0AA88YC72_PINIB|nr:hypothetical protein FSP39_010682 [Pinctada imbricata]
MATVIQSCQQLLHAQGIQTELDSMKRTFAAELNATRSTYETELQTLKSNFQAETKKLRDLVSKIQTSNARIGNAKTTNVSFSAYLNADFTTPLREQIVIFQTTRTNNGGGYDNQTGIFTAPVDGVYFFFVSLLAKRPGEFKFAVNDNTGVQLLMLSDRAGFNQVSNSVVLNMKAGEKGYVKTHWERNGNFDIYKLWSTFSGMLIHNE